VLVEPVTEEEGSGREEAAEGDGLDGDRMRESMRSRTGIGLAGVSGNGDERDDLDVAAI
jgi:hypothetical protein